MIRTIATCDIRLGITFNNQYSGGASDTTTRWTDIAKPDGLSLEQKVERAQTGGDYNLGYSGSMETWSPVAGGFWSIGTSNYTGFQRASYSNNATDNSLEWVEGNQYSSATSSTHPWAAGLSAGTEFYYSANGMMNNSIDGSRASYASVEWISREYNPTYYRVDTLTSSFGERYSPSLGLREWNAWTTTWFDSTIGGDVDVDSGGNDGLYTGFIFFGAPFEAPGDLLAIEDLPPLPINPLNSTFTVRLPDWLQEIVDELRSRDDAASDNKWKSPAQLRADHLRRVDEALQIARDRQAQFDAEVRANSAEEDAFIQNGAKPLHISNGAAHALANNNQNYTYNWGPWDVLIVQHAKPDGTTERVIYFRDRAKDPNGAFRLFGVDDGSNKSNNQLVEETLKILHTNNVHQFPHRAPKQAEDYISGDKPPKTLGEDLANQMVEDGEAEHFSDDRGDVVGVPREDGTVAEYVWDPKTKRYEYVGSFKNDENYNHEIVADALLTMLNEDPKGFSPLRLRGRFNSVIAWAQSTDQEFRKDLVYALARALRNYQDKHPKPGAPGWNVLDEGSLARQVASIATGLIPLVGDVKDVMEVIEGRDRVAGEDLAGWERGVTVIGAFIPFLSGSAVRTGVKSVVTGAGTAAGWVKGAWGYVAGKFWRSADKVDDAAKAASGNAAETIADRFPSVGVARPTTRILQTGGNIIQKGTAKALNEALKRDLHARDWGRALEALKRAEGLPNNHHGVIDALGNYWDENGNLLGDLEDFQP